MSQIWSTLDKAVGSRLRVQTVNGEAVEGYFLTFDARLNCLVLQERSKTHPKKRDLRILRSSSITELTVLPGNSEDATMNMNVLPPVDWKRQRAREEENIRRLKDEHLRSPEALHMFAALSKTYPCHWDNDTIIVLESLRLSPPYGPENLSNGTGENNMEAIVRVRKLLEREQNKLKSALGAAGTST